MSTNPVALEVDSLQHLRSQVDSFMREKGLYAQLRQAVGKPGASLLARDEAMQGIISAMESNSNFKSSRPEQTKGGQTMDLSRSSDHVELAANVEVEGMKGNESAGDFHERQLQIDLLGGRAFLDFDAESRHTESLSGADSAKFFVLYGSFGSQRFRTEPVAAKADPDIRDTIQLRLSQAIEDSGGHFRSMPTLPELLRVRLPIRLALALVSVAAPKRAHGSEAAAAAASMGTAAASQALPFESDVAGASVRTEVLAETTVEWRRVLQSGRADVALPLPALGPSGAGGVSIGVLALRFVLTPLAPKHALRPKEEIGAVLREQEVGEEVASRRLFEGARRWWREYLAVGGSTGGFRRRTVRAFARECRGGSRCVCSFVSPLMAPRLIETARQAARFVGLLPLRAAGEEGSALGGGLGGHAVGGASSAAAAAVGPEGAGEAAWQQLHTTLAARGGCIEDLANLLCSLLLGFGLDAWVCLGTSIAADGVEESHAWVTTIAERSAPGHTSAADSRDETGSGVPGSKSIASGSESSSEVVFWEPLTGERVSFDTIVKASAAVDSGAAASYALAASSVRYNRLGCMYNHRRLLANRQVSDKVSPCTFDLDDPAAWHELEPALIEPSVEPDSGVAVALCRPTVDGDALADALQDALRTKIQEARRRMLPSGAASFADVSFDRKLEHLLSPALAAYESERSTGIATGADDFQAAVRRAVPAGYVFRACPVQFSHASPDGVLEGLLASEAGRGVVLARGSDMTMAVAVKVVAFPEDVVAVWVMVAAQFRSDPVDSDGGDMPPAPVGKGIA